MNQNTKIQWTDVTWSPVRGCSRVSPGCQACYAEAQALRVYRCDRWRGVPIGKGSYDGLVTMVGGEVCPSCSGNFAGVGTTWCRTCLDLGRVGGEARWTGAVRLVPGALDAPLRMRQPKRIFVNSMSDLYHESLPDEDIDRVFAVMVLSEAREIGHTYQILTKRAERLPAYYAGNPWPRISRIIRDKYGATWGAGRAWLPERVWLGVSVESRDQLVRLDHLRETPAAVRFVSFEPLLEDLGVLDLRGIHGAIFGGESGPRARPCDLAWIRSGRDQCRAAGVATFIKQVGSNAIDSALRDIVCGGKVHYVRPSADTMCHEASIVPGYEVRPHNVSRLLKDSHGGDPAEWPEDLQGCRELPSGGGA